MEIANSFTLSARKKHTKHSSVCYLSGFTLIELMIVMTISALLIMIAIPNFSATIVRNRIDSYQKDLMRDLAYARQQAISRSSVVAMCTSIDGLSCTASTDWRQGWIVFTDLPSSAAGVVDASDQVLQVRQGISDPDQLQVSENYLQFNARGVLQVPSINTDITLTTCSDDNQYIRGVLVVNSGRAIASRGDGRSGEFVKVGVPLSCT